MRSKGRLLVVEDEAYVRESLGSLLASRGYDVALADGVSTAVELLGRHPIDLVLTDLEMPGGGGFELIRHTQDKGSRTPVVVLTGYGTVSSAVECLKAGASDYVLKPAQLEALERALERALCPAPIQTRPARGRHDESTRDGECVAVGASAPWRAVVEKLRAAAATEATVLLLGESGTGKELLARLVHRSSRRAAAPFVEVNCAAVPIDIWESEFFGHRKGAFTGAVADRLGRFRLADRGTLFVDEIAAMPYEGQAKLLRALQEREFHRLGDDEPTRVDVRIVAATNSNLKVEMAAGRFRADLFHRLNVLRIEVPPLRERPDDIPLLARHFLAQIAAQLGRTPPQLSAHTLGRLAAYDWPGNVRELRSVLERTMVFDRGDFAALELPAGTLGSVPLAYFGSQDLNLRATLGRTEDAMLRAALRRSRGVRKDAARLLGIDQRNLAYYLHKHGIAVEHP